MGTPEWPSQSETHIPHSPWRQGLNGLPPAAIKITAIQNVYLKWSSRSAQFDGDPGCGRNLAECIPQIRRHVKEWPWAQAMSTLEHQNQNGARPHWHVVEALLPLPNQGPHDRNNIRPHFQSQHDRSRNGRAAVTAHLSNITACVHAWHTCSDRTTMVPQQ